jgi:hypothetical protein
MSSARRSYLPAALAFTAVASVGPLAAAAPAHQAPAPMLPAEVAVPAGNKQFLLGHAVGVQIYTCNATGATFAWSSATPRARLFDDHGHVIASHFAGPTWQAKDGSTVVGRREDGVTVDPTAISWLRLAAVSTTSGAHGERLTATTYIQRLRTRGGLPPAADQCSAATAGKVVESPYTADYTFWKATGRR